MDHGSSEDVLTPRGTLRVGDWIVHPMADHMSRRDATVRLEARTMRLLLCLASRPGEVVSIDDLLREVWSGVIVTPDSVYQAVTALRRLLGDDPKHPTYIATVPRRGYRLIASVEPVTDETMPPDVRTGSTTSSTSLPAHPAFRRRMSWRHALAVGVLLVLAGTGAAYLLMRHRAPSASTATVPPRSVAVLPFLDLTDAMNEEPFADGMTEELIDQLSKSPGIRVSAPTSSFYYKDKQVPVADIARSLGVNYILDGSVRTSGTTMRVAARLVRAHDGFVVWSATYDRPQGDKLKVQDEIAGEAAHALVPTLR